MKTGGVTVFGLDAELHASAEVRIFLPQLDLPGEPRLAIPCDLDPEVVWVNGEPHLRFNYKRVRDAVERVRGAAFRFGDGSFEPDFKKPVLG